MQELKISRFFKGLFTDKNPNEQEKSTYTYAQNSVIETNDGDSFFISNEEGNSVCGDLPEGYFPIGKVYIGDNKNAIFSVNPELGLSEIGVIDDMCNYVTHVNTDKLNFKLTNQIDAVYRLRQGCEKTIYFTDNLNPPRIFNFNSPNNFKRNGDWDKDKFNLFKTYNRIPNFNSFTVENGGSLKSGSYNFAIQYLDEDLNPTEWITTSQPVNIIYDSLSKPYGEIRGSSYGESQYRDKRITNKSIRIDLENLDFDFPF